MKIVDYESIRCISFIDFMQCLAKSEIFLDEEDKEKIFIESYYYLNGRIKYEILITLILDLFWNEQKNRLCEDIYCLITNYGKKIVSLNTIHTLFENIFNESCSKQKLIKFIEEYKVINNCTKPISLNEIKTLFKYYTFGDSGTNCLNQLVSIIQKKLNIDGNNPQKYHQTRKEFKDCNNNNNSNKRHCLSKSMDKDYYANNRKELFKIMKRIRKIFIEYGRNSFFNFIKQFRYYENSERLIDRNNFKNVFNSFNIRLTEEEIDIIFKKFSIDRMKNLIYYEDFLKYLAVNSSNNKREELIKYIYDIIKGRAKKFNRDLNLSFLKEIYSSKNNIFIKDESDNYLDFIDCLEIFHFCYKSFKENQFYPKEFIDFYRFISFLTNSDDDFISLILNEWRISSSQFNNFLLKSNYKENRNNLNEEKKLKNYFLLELENKLKNKSVKDLINLHWKFISFCSDVSKITLYDFINILNMEHINLEKENSKEIFNFFSSNTNNEYLDYEKFIRFFKKELNANKLSIVQKIFNSLKYDIGDNDDKIPLNEVKKKYSARRHPEVISRKKREDEKLEEFREGFDINYDICNLEQINGTSKKLVDFDIFANYYEYVSFIYYDDEEFTNLLISTWC